MILKQNDVSSEGVVNKVAQNGGSLSVGDFGYIYQQYKAGTAIANTVTETSMFTGTSIAPQLVGNMAQASTTTTVPIPALPAGFMALGTGIKGDLYSTIATTGTPTLRVRVVLKNPNTGAVVYTLGDSGAVALGAITGTTELYVNFDAVCSSVGTAGSMVDRIAVTYGTTSVLNTVIKQAPASVTVDTTQGYLVDVLLTWGTASASNTTNLIMGTVGIY